MDLTPQITTLQKRSIPAQYGDWYSTLASAGRAVTLGTAAAHPRNGRKPVYFVTNLNME